MSVNPNNAIFNKLVYAGEEVSEDNPLPVNVVLGGGGGGGGGDASEETLQDILTELETVATEIPHTALDVTNDTLHSNVSRSGTGETTMVAAVSSQTTRLHSYAVTVPGAGTIEIRNGASGAVLRKHIFPAAGGLVREFNVRPYGKTSANTILVFYWSSTGEANIDFDYVTSA